MRYGRFAGICACPETRNRNSDYLKAKERERFLSAMAQFGINKDAPRWNEKPEFHEPGTAHTWLEGEEDSPGNRAAYMAYLRNTSNIEFPPNTQLFEGASEKELLSVKFWGFGNIKTSGNIDVVLADSRHQDLSTVRQNMLVGIELKKDTNKDGETIERQVTLQHLAASYLNPSTGILTIMTDLNDCWLFFWFDEEKRLLRLKASRPEALFLIKHVQDRETDDNRRRFPTFFLNRGCWYSLFGGAELGSIPENSLDEDDNFESQDDESGDWSDDFYSASKEESNRRRKARSKSAHYGRSTGDSKKRIQQRCDQNMDYLDEEEMLGAQFRMQIEEMFHKMIYFPDADKSSVSVPQEISW